MLPNDSRDSSLLRTLHIRYLKRYLDILPGELSSHDSTRLTIAFFTISGLDILNALDDLDEAKKQNIIEWIYRLQILPNDSEREECRKASGFQGSSTLIFPDTELRCSKEYACSHIAMTYTGLATLIILGDNLSRVDRGAIIEGLKALQQRDGSFCATLAGSESDMRFVYCAACICYMLRDWSGMNIEKTLEFIVNSMSYDYGIGQGPEQESHGGTTFCAVASLALMGRLETTFSLKQLAGLRKWALSRQESGFQGRPNKPVDTCYSFWVGATLQLLEAFHMVDFKSNKEYILSTQDRILGGFSKWPDTTPDPMHTCLGLGGLSLMKEKDLLPVHPGLNITLRAHKHLEEIQRLWDDK
ncbi:geranylgeranyl transferase type-1 subunit beta [Anabrus simplex]|uniref:geranylgeranyl transferase type-1 subunit beta n=1 Tax=Anabrus simplex TaxID=316456 RepID=UPI0035A2DCAD